MVLFNLPLSAITFLRSLHRLWPDCTNLFLPTSSLQIWLYRTILLLSVLSDVFCFVLQQTVLSVLRLDNSGASLVKLCSEITQGNDPEIIQQCCYRAIMSISCWLPLRPCVQRPSQQPAGDHGLFQGCARFSPTSMLTTEGKVNYSWALSGKT